MRNGSGSPVEHPVVTIGTEKLTVKIGLLAELIISRAGLSLDQAITPLKAGSKDPHNLDYLFQLFAAAVAHNYKEQGLVVLTADEWCAKVESAALVGDMEDSSPIIAAMKISLVDAVVKRWPRLRAVPADAAKATLETAPVGYENLKDIPKPS